MAVPKEASKTWFLAARQVKNLAEARTLATARPYKRSTVGQLSLVQGNRSHSPLKSACFMHEPAVVTGFKFVDGTSWGVSRGEQGRGVSA